MSSDLVQQLRRLERGFSALPASLADAEGLYEEAEDFRDEDSRVVELAEPAEVTCVWSALLQRFESLNRSLRSTAVFTETLAIQMEAASQAIQGCAQLADRLPLGPNDTAGLGSALALVFGAGMDYLHLLISLGFKTERRQAILLREMSRQLGAVATVLIRVANPDRQPEAAAVFARAAGRPQAVLPWLLTVSRALLALPLITTASAADAPTDVYGNALESYTGVVTGLFGWLQDTYTSVVQQSPAVQQAVLSVLLDRCLPFLAAEASPETLAMNSHPHLTLAAYLGVAVNTEGLRQALRRRLEQPQGAAHILQALQVMAALPLQRSPGTSTPGPFGEQHAGAASLLGHLCSTYSSPLAAMEAAAWPVLEALPSIAAMVAALAADSSIPAERAAKLCFGVTMAVGAQLQQLPSISNDSQLTTWAAATSAALWLTPVLLQLHERCQCLDSSIEGADPLKECPLLLAHTLLGLLLEGCGPIAYQYAELKFRQPATVDGRLLRQLWALHTRMCRLMAWLADDPSGARAAIASEGAKPSTDMLVERLTRLRVIMMLAGRCGVAVGVLSKGCLDGICCAHWAALQAAVQLLGGLPRVGVLLPPILMDIHSLTRFCRDLATDAALADMFSEGVALLAPAVFEDLAPGSLAWNTMLVELAPQVAEAAGGLPPLAVALARRGTLQSLLAHAQQLMDSSSADAAAALVSIVLSALHALDRAANEALAAWEEASAQQLPLLLQLQQAAGVSAGLVHSNSAAVPAMVAQLPELSSRLHTVVELADLLHQWWQPAMQPELHEQAQLMLAQAAATRSCAYLRCANLGGKGGPAAGEGVGSQRCSACRAVWYCGTACSHADWREGGHRRVCRALGAARRAAKAAAGAEGEQGG